MCQLFTETSTWLHYELSNSSSSTTYISKIPTLANVACKTERSNHMQVCRFTSIYQGTVLVGSQPRHSRTLTVMRGRSKSFMSLGWNRTLCRFDCPDPNSSRERAFVYNIWQCRERLEHWTPKRVWQYVRPKQLGVTQDASECPNMSKYSSYRAHGCLKDNVCITQDKPILLGSVGQQIVRTLVVPEGWTCMLQLPLGWKIQRKIL